MSEQMISQRVKRTCDGCGKEFTWELVGAEQPQIIEMATWYILEHNVVDFESEQFVKLKVQACSLACVPVAAVKIAILPPRPAEPSIDLNSLRAHPLAN